MCLGSTPRRRIGSAGSRARPIRSPRQRRTEDLSDPQTARGLPKRPVFPSPLGHSLLHLFFRPRSFAEVTERRGPVNTAPTSQLRQCPRPCGGLPKGFTLGVLCVGLL